jgi:hypothetical protein
LALVQIEGERLRFALADDEPAKRIGHEAGVRFSMIL